MSNRIVTIGTGPVGLVVGGSLARWENEVVCWDPDPDRVEGLRRGTLPQLEPGLDVLLDRPFDAGRLRFSSNLPGEIPGADMVFLCVDSPFRRDGTWDLSEFHHLAQRIGELVREETWVVVKSTVPTGTTDMVQERIDRVLEDRFDPSSAGPVHTVANPHFMRGRNAVRDGLNPVQIVVGSRDSEARERVAQLYRSREAPVLRTDTITAETIKLCLMAFAGSRGRSRPANVGRVHREPGTRPVQSPRNGSGGTGSEDRRRVRDVNGVDLDARMGNKAFQTSGVQGFL